MHVLVPLKFSTSFSLQEPLTATMLAAAPQQDQKQMLGERMFPLVQVRFQIFFFFLGAKSYLDISYFFPLCPKISEYFYFHSQMFSKRMFPVVWIPFLPFTFTFQKRIKSIFPGHISRSGRQGDWDAVGH